MAGKPGCGGKPGRSGRKSTWSEEDAGAFGLAMLEWFQADEERCFYKAYFGYHTEFRGHNIYPELLQRLQPVSDVFCSALKRIELLQQERLIKRGQKNPVMNIFLLKALHQYKDTHYVEQTSRIIKEETKQELAKLSPDQLKDRIRVLTTNDN